MPIAIKDLEDAQRPLEGRILGILSAKPDQAFALSDIFCAIEKLDSTAVLLIFALTNEQQRESQFGPYREALANLKNLNQIKAATHNGAEYYYVANR